MLAILHNNQLWVKKCPKKFGMWYHKLWGALQWDIAWNSLICDINFIVILFWGRRGLIGRDKIRTFSADSIWGLPQAFPQHFPRLHQKCRFWYIAMWRQGPTVPYFVTSFCKAVRFHRLFKLCSALASTSATRSTTFSKQKWESIFFMSNFFSPQTHRAVESMERNRLVKMVASNATNLPYFMSAGSSASITQSDLRTSLNFSIFYRDM